MKTKLLKKIRKRYCITKTTLEETANVGGRVINLTDKELCFANGSRSYVYEVLPLLIYRLHKDESVFTSSSIRYAAEKFDYLPLYEYKYESDSDNYIVSFRYDIFEREVMKVFYSRLIEDFKEVELKKYKLLILKRAVRSFLRKRKSRLKHNKIKKEFRKNIKEGIKLDIQNNKFRW